MGVSTRAGFTLGWPEWALLLWVGMVVVGTFATVLILGNAAGLLTDRSLAKRGDPAGRVPPLRVFIAVYTGFVLGSVGLALLLDQALGLPARGGVLVLSGGIFVVASSGRPWWLYETMRRVRWFGSIRSDATMRMLLLLIGVFAVVAGLLMASGGSGAV